MTEWSTEVDGGFTQDVAEWSPPQPGGFPFRNEPCLDYSVPKCTHEVAFCKCGHRYKFYHSFFSGEKYLWDKFCPFCSSPNPHKTEIQPTFSPGPLVRSTHLICNICKKSAESYAHKFCNACQTPYGWDQE